MLWLIKTDNRMSCECKVAHYIKCNKKKLGGGGTASHHFCLWLELKCASTVAPYYKLLHLLSHRLLHLLLHTIISMQNLIKAPWKYVTWLKCTIQFHDFINKAQLQPRLRRKTLHLLKRQKVQNVFSHTSCFLTWWCNDAKNGSHNFSPKETAWSCGK